MRKATDTGGIVTIFLRAGLAVFIPQFAWEMAHMSAYQAMDTLSAMVIAQTCGRAAAGDAVITLSLISPWLLRRRRPTVLGHTVLVAAGAVVAVVIERLSLAAGRWSYDATMPMVPGFNVGLWPLLQMAILPSLSLWLALGVRSRSSQASSESSRPRSTKPRG
jgi:uncharacterized membrane protein